MEFTQSWHVLECNESLHRQSVDGYIKDHQQMYGHDGRGFLLQRHEDEHMEYPSQLDEIARKVTHAFQCKALHSVRVAQLHGDAWRVDGSRCEDHM